MNKNDYVALALYHRGRANRMTVCANSFGLSCGQRDGFRKIAKEAWGSVAYMMGRARVEGGMAKRQAFHIARNFEVVAVVHALSRDEAGELFEDQCALEGIECEAYLLGMPLGQVQGESRFVCWGSGL